MESRPPFLSSLFHRPLGVEIYIDRPEKPLYFDYRASLLIMRGSRHKSSSLEPLFFCLDLTKQAFVTYDTNWTITQAFHIVYWLSLISALSC